MLSKADEEQLQRVCGNDETLAEARKLIPLAKTRTKQGSGHYLQGLNTALPAVCAYVTSKHLNNNDVALDSARQSSCLNTKDFTKALQIVSTVLEAELSPRKRRKEITYDILHEKYHVGMSFSSFSTFLRQAEHALVQLDMRHKIDTPDYRCAIFFWASSVIKVKELPTIDEFAQDNSLLPKRLTPIIKLLDDKCNTLKTKLAEAAKNPSRPSSPTKQPSTPRTPRRSPTKPLRELPTRESIKKQRQNPPPIEASLAEASQESQVVEMVSLETPTKKRKLDTPRLLTVSPSKKRLPFPPTTPTTSHITHITSPTKTRPTTTAATIPSPLRRSARIVLQEEVDDEMDVDEDGVGVDINRSLEVDLFKVGKDDEEEEGLEEEPIVMRRFRPVYQDFKQWYARDARVLRMRKVADEGLTNEVAV